MPPAISPALASDTEQAGLAKFLHNLIATTRMPSTVSDPDNRLQAPLIHFPGELRLQSLETYLANPVRKRASVELEDVQGFVEYLAKFKELSTRIFYQLSTTGGRFVALIDYHDASSGDIKTQAHWGDHVCVLVTEYTEEWKRWAAISGKLFPQEQFARFIEENRLDIVDPDGATMLELVKTLNATRKVKFDSAVRLDNGDRQLNFTKETTATVGRGEIEIPQKIKLQLPLFLDGAAYEVEAFFRFRIDDEGGLGLGIEMDRPHKVIEGALTVMAQRIEEESGIKLIRGKAQVRQP